MKQWILRASLLILALILAMTCVACGSSDDKTPDNEDLPKDPTQNDGNTLSVENYDPSKTYTMPDFLTLKMADYITLGRYRGLTLQLDYDTITVTDDELDAEIDMLLREHHPDFKVTDRAVAWGDTVVTDYVGTLDGVAFNGGTATAQTITLQDNSGYIPGFAEGLVGAMPGEAYPVDVTFPANYHSADLAGKAVVFTFTVHYIEGSPELDDAFVNDYTDGEYTSAAGYRESIRQQMADAAYETQQHSALWATIIENAAVKKYPEDAVLAYYSDYYNYYNYYASMYGVDYETFLSMYVGGTPEDLFEFCKQAIKEEMVYYAVFEAENYSYTDEQYARALDLYTAQNYAALKAEMLAAGREEFPIEEAHDYFDRTYGKQIGMQCLEESAFNDLIEGANIVITGAPVEGES